MFVNQAESIIHGREVQISSEQEQPAPADAYLNYLLRIDPIRLMRFAISVPKLRGTKYHCLGNAAAEALKQYGIDVNGCYNDIIQSVFNSWNSSEGLPRKSDIPPIDLSSVARRVLVKGEVTTVEFSMEDFWAQSTDPDRRALMQLWHIAHTGTVNTRVNAIIPTSDGIHEVIRRYGDPVRGILDVNNLEIRQALQKYSNIFQVTRGTPPPNVICCFPGFGNTPKTFVPVLQDWQRQAQVLKMPMIGFTLGLMGSDNTLAPDDLRALLGHDTSTIPYTMTGAAINAFRLASGMYGDEGGGGQNIEIGWSMGAMALIEANVTELLDEMRRLRDGAQLPPHTPLRSQKTPFSIYWTPSPANSARLVNAIPPTARWREKIQAGACDVLVQVTRYIGRLDLGRNPLIDPLVVRIAGYFIDGDSTAAVVHCESLKHGPEVAKQRRTLRTCTGMDPARARLLRRGNFPGVVVYAQGDKITPPGYAKLSIEEDRKRASAFTDLSGAPVEPLPDITIKGGHGSLFVDPYRGAGYYIILRFSRITPSSGTQQGPVAGLIEELRNGSLDQASMLELQEIGRLFTDNSPRRTQRQNGTDPNRNTRRNNMDSHSGRLHERIWQPLGTLWRKK